MPVAEHFGKEQVSEKSNEILVELGNSFKSDRRLFKPILAQIFKANVFQCSILRQDFNEAIA